MNKIETFECEHCHYVGFIEPKINSKCPNCGYTISAIVARRAESREPGVGLALLVSILAFFIPILPGIAALLIALKSKSIPVMIIAWLGVVISILQIFVIVFALLR